MTRQRAEKAVKRIKEHYKGNLAFGMLSDNYYEAMTRAYMEFEAEDFDANSQIWFIENDRIFKLEEEKLKIIEDNMRLMMKSLTNHLDEIEKEG